MPLRPVDLDLGHVGPPSFVPEAFHGQDQQGQEIQEGEEGKSQGKLAQGNAKHLLENSRNAKVFNVINRNSVYQVPLPPHHRPEPLPPEPEQIPALRRAHHAQVERFGEGAVLGQQQAEGVSGWVAEHTQLQGGVAAHVGQLVHHAGSFMERR